MVLQIDDMGRSDDRWDDATKTRTDDETIVTCNYCSQIWRNTSLVRVSEHMMTCKKLLEERYQVYGRDKGPPAKQARIAEDVWKWTAYNSRAANKDLAEAIYSSGVPFSLVSHLLVMVLRFTDSELVGRQSCVPSIPEAPSPGVRPTIALQACWPYTRGDIQRDEGEDRFSVAEKP